VRPLAPGPSVRQPRHGRGSPGADRRRREARPWSSLDTGNRGGSHSPTLWRGEVVFAKFALDYDAKLGALRRFLEWRIEIDQDWSRKPGAYGRGLERLLPAEIWSELASTYVGVDLDENWNALFRTTALFRRVVTEVGDALGYRYPQEVHGAVTAYLLTVQDLPRSG
jgi:aminoglycoside 6-adenylyltransferase